jgi:hypothetical protein
VIERLRLGQGLNILALASLTWTRTRTTYVDVEISRGCSRLPRIYFLPGHPGHISRSKTPDSPVYIKIDKEHSVFSLLLLFSRAIGTSTRLRRPWTRTSRLAQDQEYRHHRRLRPPCLLLRTVSACFGSSRRACGARPMSRDPIG